MPAPYAFARKTNRAVRYTGMFYGPEGKPHSAGTYRSERDALKAATIEQDKVDRGKWFDPRNGEMAFSAYFEDEWITHRVLEINTRETYWSHYRATLKPKFGDMPLRDIKRPVVQRWVSEMIRAGVKPGAIRAKYKALQTILAAKDGVSAFSDGHIEANPCAGVSLPKVVGREVTIYTPDETDRLLETLHPWFRLLVLCASETGLRWGELLGMRVRDVNFMHRLITVNQTIVETKVANTGNGTRFTMKPYPKEARNFYEKRKALGISSELAAALSRHVADRGLGAEDHLFAMPLLHGNTGEIVEEVCRTEAWPQGLPISRNYFRDRIWLPAIAAAEVPVRRPHDLRASNISWMLAGGTDPVTAMERVGHTQWSTMKRYTTRLPGADERAIEAIAAVRARYRKDAR